MYKKILFCSALSLSACATGTPPFGGAGSDADSGASESATELYVGDEGDMNNLVYDADNDELVINNLPFDGVDGRYLNTGGTFLDGFQVYASQQDGESGRFQYYAVHAVAANGRAGAAGTAAYKGYGHGGAMISRHTNRVELPVGRGELVYTGNYAGIRVTDDVPGSGTGITFADGDATVYVDLLDFDVTGAVAGSINNRSEYDVNGGYVGTLQSIVLNETADISSEGVINGTAATYDVGSSGALEVLQAGTYTAVFAGRNGEQLIGTVRITGDLDAIDPELGNVQETGVFITSN